MIRRAGVSLAAVLLCVHCGVAARAAPVSLTLSLTTDSSIDVLLSTLNGLVEGSTSFALSGTLDAQLDDAIDDLAATNDTTSIQLLDAAIDLSDETLVIDLGLLGGVEVFYQDLGINQLDSGGPLSLTTVNPVDPFAYTLDPGENGFSATIDEGFLSFTGTGNIGQTLGINSAPIAPTTLTFGSLGQVAALTQDVTVNGQTVSVDVRLSMPVTFDVEAIATDPTTVDITITGLFVATGSYTTVIPEPSTLILVGLAALGMLPLGRRLLHRRRG